jgi:hypothetical protein
VATPNDIGSVDNVLRDATTREEARLVGVYERVDGRLEPGGEDLSDSFHNTILQGDRPELRWGVGTIRLGEEDKEGTVDTR